MSHGLAGVVFLIRKSCVADPRQSPPRGLSGQRGIFCACSKKAGVLSLVLLCMNEWKQMVNLSLGPFGLGGWFSESTSVFGLFVPIKSSTPRDAR